MIPGQFVKQNKLKQTIKTINGNFIYCLLIRMSYLEFIKSYREYKIDGRQVIILGEIHHDINKHCAKHNNHIDIVSFVKNKGPDKTILLEYNPSEDSAKNTLSKNLVLLSQLKHVGSDVRIRNCVSKLYHKITEDVYNIFVSCLGHLSELIEKEVSKNKNIRYLDEFLDARVRGFKHIKHLIKNNNFSEAIEILKVEYAYMADYYLIERILNTDKNYIILIGLVHANHLHSIFSKQCVYEVVSNTCCKV